MTDALELIKQERQRQEEKWGPQDHKDVDSGKWGSGLLSRTGLIRRLYETASDEGEMNWMIILLEEVAEARDEVNAGNTEKLKEELVQVAAVAAAWIEAIDRRCR